MSDERDDAGVGEGSGAPRFLRLADVAEVLNISARQAYLLVRSKELRGVKIGGRGQWRVEAVELERYISRLYRETERFLDAHPLTRADADPADPADDDPADVER